MMVERLFLAMPWGCLRFVIVVFPDHTHYFFDLNMLSYPERQVTPSCDLAPQVMYSGTSGSVF